MVLIVNIFICLDKRKCLRSTLKFVKQISYEFIQSIVIPVSERCKFCFIKNMLQIKIS